MDLKRHSAWDEEGGSEAAAMCSVRARLVQVVRRSCSSSRLLLICRLISLACGVPVPAAHSVPAGHSMCV